MTQQSIPIQPRETAVTAALRDLADANGWCVTHTTDGQHATASLHYSGRAVDLADFSGAGYDTVQLLTINEAVLHVLPLSLISELIYAGPGNVCVKNGRIIAGMAVYGASTMAEHHNHVHLGVVPTFAYNTPAVPEVKVKPMFDPPLQVVDAIANPGGPGVYALGQDGGVYAFGGAPYRGPDHQPLGKDYWAGRTAARIEALGSGYSVFATSGERYDYP